MHDLDRHLNEYEAEFEDYEGDEYGADEEWEAEFDDYEDSPIFDEAEEMELAAELLSVSDDEELEYFLGKLIKKAGRKIKRFAKSSTGKALGRVLKGAAKKALPIVGGALGGPAGAGLASHAGRVFGLELEGLSPEDQDFEVARRVVRFAGEAAKNAAKMPPNADAKKAAVAAASMAAKRHAPGLVRAGRLDTSPKSGSGRGGRWVRRGNTIVVMGL